MGDIKLLIDCPNCGQFSAPDYEDVTMDVCPSCGKWIYRDCRICWNSGFGRVKATDEHMRHHQEFLAKFPESTAYEYESEQEDKREQLEAEEAEDRASFYGYD